MRGRYEVWAITPLPRRPEDPDAPSYEATFWRYGPTLEEAEKYIEAHANDKAFYNESTNTVYTYLTVVEGGTW